MNKKFDYTAQIEKYLEGNMSGDEMKTFESSLQKDPTLKAEFQLQKDIVNSLKEFRKAELKARLNQINVGSYSGISTGLKIALSVALSASVGLGIYYFSKQNTEVENTPKVEQVDEKTPSELEEPILPETSSNESSVSLEEETEVPQPTAKSTEEVKGSETLGDDEQPNAGNNVKVVTPSVIESFENDKEFEEISTETEAPKNALENEIDQKELNAIEIESNGDNSNNFHYKFYNSKLYLYGDFKNIPYEIIEFNTVSGKSLYLYYQGNFYYLELNQMEVTPLQKINEEKLIEELDSLRVKK